jgi:chromosome segregation ATPase
LADVNKSLETLEQKITDTKEKERVFNEQCGGSRDFIKVKTDNENRFIELTEHLNKLKAHKKQNDFYHANKNKIEEYKSEYQKLPDLQNEIKTLSDKLRDKTEEVLDLTNKVNNAKNQLEAEERKYDSADSRIESAKNNLIPIDDYCPTCGAKLSAKKKQDLMKIL